MKYKDDTRGITGKFAFRLVYELKREALGILGREEVKVVWLNKVTNNTNTRSLLHSKCFKMYKHILNGK